MVILGIETSCDETSLALIDIATAGETTTFKVLSHEVLSQTIHSQFGGVFPMMAKREHSQNLIPIFKKILESSFGNSKFEAPHALGQIRPLAENPKPARTETPQSGGQIVNTNTKTILNREPELLEQFEKVMPTLNKPPIDLIAVTEGPGLEPALWVGINFASALSEFWDIPVVPVNHMEGHIFSALICAKENPKHEIRNTKQIQNSKQEENFQIRTIVYPAIALLISGGHTQLVLIKKEQEYEVVGDTRDDAVGEAFDKIARILGLPYPGGPQISALAEQARAENFYSKNFPLPRPMLKTPDLDFSFSGLKTAVLYAVKKLQVLTKENKKEIALETENAISEVLTTKTAKAIEKYGAKTLIISGGVTANTHIRKSFEDLANQYQIPILMSEKKLSTDNALMIAIAGYFRNKNFTTEKHQLKADGTKSL